MCSWCWGFDRVYTQLLNALADSIEVIRLLGGLAPDSGEPMPMEMRSYLQTTWKTIAEAIPGTRFNHDFWTDCQPRRSTWPACRAVIAARDQGMEFDPAMTRAIQRGYYLEAKNPSDDSVLIEFATQIGLNENLFTRELNSQHTRDQLEQEITYSRQLGVRGFPSLLVLNGDDASLIEIDYNDANVMLTNINSVLAGH